MNATDLLAELRPPLDTVPDDPHVLDRIMQAPPLAAPPRTAHLRRPMVALGATAVVAAGALALAPSSDVGPTGIARAAAALAQPDVLLHFTATTTFQGGGVQRAETWQTPDGRLSRVIDGRGGIETAYDQAGGTFETYIPERDEIRVETKANFPETFEDRDNPFGTITSGSHSQVGDLPALVRRALQGDDPAARHVGRTTVRGVDVDHIRVLEHQQVADVPAATRQTLTDRPAAARRALTELRDAPSKTITIVHDVYVRHDDALPVRVVQQPGYDAGATTDFDDVQQLELGPATRRLLELGDHPGADRRIEPPFDDSKADAAAGD
jgi:hypothetical protein